MALSSCGPGLIRSRPCLLPSTLSWRANRRPSFQCSFSRSATRFSRSPSARALLGDDVLVIPAAVLGDGAGGLLDTRSDLLHRVGCAVGYDVATPCLAAFRSCRDRLPVLSALDTSSRSACPCDAHTGPAARICV